MEPDKSKNKIQKMFAEIAGNYDLANSVLSLGLHHYWKKSLVKTVLNLNAKGLVLDLCSGTGDIHLALRASGINSVAVDFVFPMLQRHRKRAAGLAHPDLIQADALSLPFCSESFSAITIAYGVRNFESLPDGLTECARVLKPGGTIIILESGKAPSGFFGFLIKIYANYLVPILGWLVSGKFKAYSYLAESSRHFPSGQELVNISGNCGFSCGSFKTLSAGASFIYILKKA